ncbi:class V chitinase CHIT5-like [Abrus precatorius]|uniref:Class V chitinase CHIT5-like n=1 Tax=Abrus precatorius TaxID=3816 RepID=A0A8B8JNA2_ABRPR|nr:class V chitinase CHIT5-like [Abrus precatorius]
MSTKPTSWHIYIHIQLTTFLAHSHSLMINMALQRQIITPLLVIFMILHSYALHEPSNWEYEPSRGSVRAAYWPSGSDFSPSSIDTKYFTHIYYAFIEPDPLFFNLNVTEFHKKWIPNFINGLRYRHPPVKTLLSIGGGGSNSTAFSLMASTKQNRQVFIKSTIHVAREYGFNGLDLDWEFPETELDMSNLGLLFQEWHQALVVEAQIQRKPRLLLTSAVYYASTIKLIGNGPRSYPAQAITKYLDWASPMCFDYHGTWANFTGFNAALYDPNSNISTRYGIGLWIESGVPPEKLVMGLPLYGRAWKLQDPNVHGVGAEAVGEATDTDGTMDYDEILVFNKDNGANVVYDEVAVSFYSYADTTWIGYDDGPSITKKVRFAKSKGLKGYFFWAIGKDKDWTISRQASNTWGH